MPKGVYEHRHVGNRKPACECGQCAKCHINRQKRRSYYKRRGRPFLEEISDQELERRLVEHFRAKGWD